MPNFTPNYNLEKPLGSEFYSVEVQNSNMDKLDATLKNLSDNAGGIGDLTNEVAGINNNLTTHLSENRVSAHKAKNIALEDLDGLFVGTELETAMKELFTNVSNGKQLIGTAITDVDDSLIVPTNPTFQNLADLIGMVSTGKKLATGTAQSYIIASTTSPVASFYGITVNGLNFKPSTIIIFEQGRDYLTIYLKDRSENQYTIFAANTSISTLGSQNTKIEYGSFTLRTGTTSRTDYTWWAYE